LEEESTPSTPPISRTRPSQLFDSRLNLPRGFTESSPTVVSLPTVCFFKLSCRRIVKLNFLRFFLFSHPRPLCDEILRPSSYRCFRRPSSRSSRQVFRVRARLLNLGRVASAHARPSFLLSFQSCCSRHRLHGQDRSRAHAYGSRSYLSLQISPVFLASSPERN